MTHARPNWAQQRHRHSDTARTVAERLKEIVIGFPAPLPDEVAGSADPLRVFACAAGADPMLGEAGSKPEKARALEASPCA